MNNLIIQSQRLNGIILLNDYKLLYNNFAINSNGDLVLETSLQENREIRLFYGPKKMVIFFFENSNKNNGSKRRDYFI